jgi:hypothetical protein
MTTPISDERLILPTGHSRGRQHGRPPVLALRGGRRGAAPPLGGRLAGRACRATRATIWPDVRDGLLRRLAAAAFVLLAASPALYAQSAAGLGVGAALTLYDPASQQADNPPAVGVIARMRRGSGLGATVGLEWYTSSVRTDVGGQPVPLGDIHVRPVMAGVSYIRQYRRYALSTALVAGYSFNSLRPTAAAQAAYQDRLGMPNVRLEVANSFAFRPDVTLWYELGHHFAASASLAYLFARPTVTAVSSTGRRDARLDLSATVITFGVAYGVF